MRHNLILIDEDNDIYYCNKCQAEGEFDDFKFVPCVTIQGESESEEAVHKRDCFKTTIAIVDEDETYIF